jgi:hypothetical protein
MWQSKGKGGHRGPTKDGRGSRPWVLRGHPYNQTHRLRLVNQEPVGFVQDEWVTLAAAFEYAEGNDTEHKLMARELLLKDVTTENALLLDDMKYTTPTSSTVHVEIRTDLVSLLNPAVLAEGHFLLDGEDKERGIFVLEPLWSVVSPESITEQNWRVRFSGITDSANPYSDLPELFKVYADALQYELKHTDLHVSPSTMKRVEKDTLGALSAARIWELYSRHETRKGQHMFMHNLHEPWSLKHAGGTSASHDDWGTPVESTRLKDVVQDAIRQRGPAVLEVVFRSAAEKAAAVLTGKTQRQIVPVVRFHMWANKAAQMAASLQAPTTPFGKPDPELTALRVLSLPGRGSIQPLELIKKLYLSGVDPLACAGSMYKAGNALIKNNGMITVYRVLVYGVQNPGQTEHLLGTDETLSCRAWTRDDRFRPEENLDYWIVSSEIRLSPPVEQFQGALDSLLSKIDETLDEVVMGGVTEGAKGGELWDASIELAKAREAHKVAQIKAKTVATKQMTRAATGKPVNKRERDERDSGDERPPPREDKKEPEPEVKGWRQQMIRINMSELDSELEARWEDVRKWVDESDVANKSDARQDNDLRVKTVVEYGLHVGAIPAHLGVGNARVEKASDNGDPRIPCNIVLYINEQPLRVKQLLNMPLSSIWEKMLKAQVDLEFRELEDGDPHRAYTMEARYEEDEEWADPPAEETGDGWDGDGLVQDEGEEKAEEKGTDATEGEQDVSAPTTQEQPPPVVTRMVTLDPGVAVFVPVEAALMQVEDGGDGAEVEGPSVSPEL